jgi:hypothetical protein
MKKQPASLKEAEEFVRRALSKISGKPANKKEIRQAAEKITKAMPRIDERPRKVA